MSAANRDSAPAELAPAMGRPRSAAWTPTDRGLVPPEERESIDLEAITAEWLFEHRPDVVDDLLIAAAYEAARLQAALAERERCAAILLLRGVSQDLKRAAIEHDLTPSEAAALARQPAIAT